MAEPEPSAELPLVHTLNDLLTALKLPITLHTPTDLTPSLLVAVLESCLRVRLPLTPELRSAKTFNAKLQCMKIFLGILESDVLKRDVGLNTVDPRKLAVGSWDEVIVVAEVLCWIGMRLGLLQFPEDYTPPPRLEESLLEQDDDEIDVSVYSTTTGLTRQSQPESTTTVDQHSLDRAMNLLTIHDLPSPSILLSPLSPFTGSHLKPVSSNDDDDDFFLSDEQRSQRTRGSETVSVRYDGHIAPVDFGWEIESFESSHHTSKSLDEDDSSFEPLRHTSSQVSVTVTLLLGPDSQF